MFNFEIIQGLEIKVIASSFPENLDKNSFKTPVDYVVENSRLKALDVSKSMTVIYFYLGLVKIKILIFNKIKDQRLVRDYRCRYRRRNGKQNL